MFEDHKDPSIPKNMDLSIIYKRCKFYKYRECSTCNIQRLPKASHCGACNNCVKGYDHHCTLLNNCVGKRNLRTFMILLFAATIFYFFTGVIGLLAMIYEPVQDGQDPTHGFTYDSIVSIIICSIQIIKFIFNCCCT